jgi:hypothetical protein
MPSRQCPDAFEAVLPNRSRQPLRPRLGNSDGLCAHSLRFCQRGLEPLFPASSLGTFGACLICLKAPSAHGSNSYSTSDSRTGFPV